MSYLLGWKGYVAAAILAMGLAGYVQQLRVDAVKSELKTEQVKNTNLMADNAVCAQNVKTSQDAVKALVDASETRKEQVAKDMAAADKQAVALETEIERLRNFKPKSTDVCGSITELRNEYSSQK